MNVVDKNKIIIYTDGSSLGNPGPGGWGAVVALVQGDVVELGGAEKKTTNNKMELTAAIEALKYVKKPDEEIILYTDSSYTINGITKWVKGWQLNGWMKKDKTEVQNRDLWEELMNASSGKNINWQHVSGHSGLIGNERADEIATSFAQGNPKKLFKGKFKEYDIDIFDTSYNEKAKNDRKKNRTRSRAKAYSYLSFVNGVLARHNTWVECEACVKGEKNVKYRKAINAKDEEQIKKEWGL